MLSQPDSLERIFPQQISRWVPGAEAGDWLAGTMVWKWNEAEEARCGVINKLKEKFEQKGRDGRIYGWHRKQVPSGISNRSLN